MILFGCVIFGYGNEIVVKEYVGYIINSKDVGCKW